MKLITRIILPAVLLLASTTQIAHAQSTNPTFEVITPTENQTLYGNKVPILFRVTNFQLSASTDPKAKGEGHILIWLDELVPTVDNATKVTDNTFTYSDVPYKDHKLTAELVTTDNKSLTPPQKTTINFTSAQLASAQDDQTASSGFDKNTAIVILVVVALVILAAWWYTKDDEEENEKQKTQSEKTKTSKKTTKGSKKKPKRK